jgi:hypothetical protein
VAANYKRAATAATRFSRREASALRRAGVWVLRVIRANFAHGIQFHYGGGNGNSHDYGMGYDGSDAGGDGYGFGSGFVSGDGYGCGFGSAEREAQ